MTKSEKIQEILKDQHAAMQAMVTRQNALTGGISGLREAIAANEAALRAAELEEAEAAKLAFLQVG